MSPSQYNNMISKTTKIGRAAGGLRRDNVALCYLLQFCCVVRSVSWTRIAREFFLVQKMLLFLLTVAPVRGRIFFFFLRVHNILQCLGASCKNHDHDGNTFYFIFFLSTDAAAVSCCCFVVDRLWHVCPLPRGNAPDRQGGQRVYDGPRGARGELHEKGATKVVWPVIYCYTITHINSSSRRLQRSSVIDNV